MKDSMDLRHLWGSRVIASIAALALLVAACGDDAEPTPTPTGTAPPVTSTATPSSTLRATVTRTSTPTPGPSSTAPPTATRPPNISTGVPALDTIVQAVLAADLDAIEARVQLRSLACGPQQGSSSPPRCPTGQPTGTMVSVLPVATCEGEWRPQSAVRESFMPLTGASPQLYAVYGMPQQFQQLIPDGQYVAVFGRDAGSQGELGAGVVIAGDRIVGLWFGCGATPDQIVPAGTSTILPPRT